MNPTLSSARLAALSSDARINAVVGNFIDAWKAGARPVIATYLVEVPSYERPQVLARLAEIDIQFRRENGEDTADFREYIDRFPHDSDVLRQRQQNADDSIRLSVDSTGNAGRPRGSLEPLNETVSLVDSTLRRIGRYELRERLGRGGFGVVYRAFDPELHREVAVKLLRSDRVDVERYNSGMLDEARKVAALNHPGIVRVYDVGMDDGRVYIVSELAVGGTLSDLLRAHRFPWHKSALLVAAIADSLHYAHKRGIVHRDLKPQNVLMDENGQPRIADFGLAVTEQEQLEEMGGPMGTYAYMSPELARGDSQFVDARTDVYSLGVILYLALTNRLPFVANDAEQLRTLVIQKEPRPPRTIDEQIPVELERICLKCLAKNVGERYTTAYDFSADLQRVVSQAKDKPNRRIPWTTALVGLAVLALMGVAAWSLANRKSDAIQEARPSSPNDRESFAVPPSYGSTSSQPRPIGETTDIDDFPSVAEFDQHPLELGEWTQGLNRPPKILMWPQIRRNSSIRHRVAIQDLQVTSEGLALLQLGSTAADNYALQATLFQPGWEGGAGFFFGYQPDSNDPSIRRLQVVSIKRVRDRGVEKLTLIREFLKIDDVGKIRFRQEAPFPGYSVPIGQEAKLLVEIKKCKLARAEIALIPSQLPPEQLLSSIKPIDYHGSYGLYISRANSVFRNVHVRVDPAP